MENYVASADGQLVMPAALDAIIVKGCAQTSSSSEEQILANTEAEDFWAQLRQRTRLRLLHSARNLAGGPVQLPRLQAIGARRQHRKLNRRRPFG